jgi:hypothetical protein
MGPPFRLTLLPLVANRSEVVVERIPGPRRLDLSCVAQDDQRCVTREPIARFATPKVGRGLVEEHPAERLLKRVLIKKNALDAAPAVLGKLLSRPLFGLASVDHRSRLSRRRR